MCWISKAIALRRALLQLQGDARDDYCAYGHDGAYWAVFDSLGPPFQPNAPWACKEPQGPPAPAPRPAPTVRVAADPGRVSMKYTIVLPSMCSSISC